MLLLACGRLKTEVRILPFYIKKLQSYLLMHENQITVQQPREFRTYTALAVQFFLEIGIENDVWGYMFDRI